MKYFLLLIFFFAIYFGIHFFLWFSFVHFFSISNQLYKFIMLGVIVFLSISFILSTIFVHLSHNILARGYYYISGFWVGLVIYLLIGFILAWIAYLIMKHFEVDHRLAIGIIATGFALLVTIHGAWNALNPVVKNVSVNINKLPAEWKGKTIVQLSDVHLGAINGVRFMEKVVKQVNSLDPYIVVITGDLFDGMGSHPDNYIDILNNIKTQKGIYFVTGNHEIYIGRDKALGALKQTKINVLEDEMALVGGVQIIGLSFPDMSKKIRKNIVSEIQGYSPEKPSILLYHEPTNLDQGMNDSSWHASRYLSPDTDFSIQKESGIDLQLSGHTHAGQFFPFNIITKWIFNGYHYGLFQEDGFQLYVTSGTGTWGMPIRNVNKSEIVAIKVN